MLRDMQQRGILVKAVSLSSLAEEAGFAYKNISEVVETVDGAGITKKGRNWIVGWSERLAEQSPGFRQFHRFVQRIVGIVHCIQEYAADP